MGRLFARQTAKAAQGSEHEHRTDHSISLMIEQLDRLNRGLELLVQDRTAALSERESQLQAQNMRFHAAINNMPQALLMFDASQRLVICNERHLRLYDLSPDTVQPGCTLRELLEHRKATGTLAMDIDEYAGKLLSAISQHETMSRLIELPDGREISIVNHPMADGGWLAIHEDITGRRSTDAPAMDERMKARHELEIALRKALATGDFELHYQPLVGVENNRITGCEALLRWKHPERGLISPAEFIPVAEEIGLIVPLGEWVLRKACADAAQWPDDIKVAVNLSPIQVMNQNLVTVVVGALAAAGLPPRRLEVEITESVLMRNTETTMATLHRLRELGVRISMDDFGTGYSSLSYLRCFPFDKIKIDRCFISDLPDGSDSIAIVRAVAGLARSLNMEATAEGVETQAQLDQVRALGCSEMQGYLFSAPLPLEKLTVLLEPYHEARAKSAYRNSGVLPNSRACSTIA